MPTFGTYTTIIVRRYDLDNNASFGASLIHRGRRDRRVGSRCQRLQITLLPSSITIHPKLADLPMSRAEPKPVILSFHHDPKSFLRLEAGFHIKFRNVSSSDHIIPVCEDVLANIGSDPLWNGITERVLHPEAPDR